MLDLAYFLPTLYLDIVQIKCQIAKGLNVSLVLSYYLKNGFSFTILISMGENCSFVVHFQHQKSSEAYVQLINRLSSRMHNTWTLFSQQVRQI